MAARLGFGALTEQGASVLDAATLATSALEDDPIFNAGTGSALRLDGETVQMDAAVMDGRGGFGAVAAIERVKNPVRVARAVFESPHRILAGDGATRFARTLGMIEHDPVTDRARQRHRARLAELGSGGTVRGWGREEWSRAWNYPRPLPRELEGCDTVGVVARDARGRFACAASSGGFGAMLCGRVGDVPIPGAGCYAGPDGAVCATGDGEAIIGALVSLRVHEWMGAGMTAAEAVGRGLRLLPDGVDLGILAVGRADAAAGSRPSMAWAAMLEGGVRKG